MVDIKTFTVSFWRSSADKNKGAQEWLAILR
jgi:hypothetical protein